MFNSVTHVVRAVSIALLILVCAVPLLAQRVGNAALAYVESRRVVIADDSGRTIRTVRLPLNMPVSQLAVNVDGTALIATVKTFGRGEMGGDLFLWTAAARSWKRLTHGPYVFRQLEKGHREVYDGPEFSRDGSSIAFAIHTESLYDDNDVIDAAGPLALMDVKTGRIQVIKSTLGDGKDPTGPPWYANEPHWSPDGSRILLNFESGFATVTFPGGRLKNVDPSIDGSAGTTAINWIDGSNVLFLSFSENGAEEVPYALDLGSGRVSSPPVRFSSLPGRLMSFNRYVFVVDVAGEREVHGRSVWKLPKPGIFGLVPLR